MDEITGQTSPAAKEATSGLITLFDGLTVLSRGWRTVLLWAVIGAVAGLGAIFLPSTYTAEAVIMPPQSSSSMGSIASQLESLSSLSGGGGAALSSLKSNQDLYVALLQTATVQDSFIEQFHLSEEYRKQGLVRTRKALKKYLDIDGTGKDGLIRVSISDHNAQRAADLANGYVRDFQQFSRSLAFSEASQRRVFFEQQLAAEKEKLTEAEENLRKSQQASGTLELDVQTRALIQAAATLRAQVAAKEVQVESIRSYAGTGNVELIEAEQELDSLRGELSKVSGSNPDSSAGLLVPKSELPQTALDFIRTTRDLKYHETLFGILERQLETARLDEARQGMSIQIIDVASAPDQPSSLQPSLKVLFGVMFGVFLGCAIVFAQSFITNLKAEPEVRIRLSELSNSFRKV
jgi:tyrosine-protein kinase Etk/Wzc